MTKTKLAICPYCGDTQPAGDRCRACGGLFEPLSRLATHNAMGPWFVRDPGKLFHPGCSYETLVRMIDRGQVTKSSIVRGPTTKQFWTIARRVPGVAHLLGYCHNCDASVDAEDHGCHACGVPFGAYLDRNFLGLPEVRPLPWEADYEEGPYGDSGASRLARSGRPEGGGISQFASDDELLATGAEGSAPSAGVVASRIASGRWRETTSAPAAAEPATPEGEADVTTFDEPTSAVVARALRRRVIGQRRTIRVLAVVSVAGLVIALASNLDRIAAVTSGGDDASPQQPLSGQLLEAPDEAPSEALEEAQTEAILPAGPPAEENTSAAEPVKEPTEPSVSDSYVEALRLISQASQPDRSIKQRTADMEQALEALQKIRQSAPEDQWPPDLAELLDHAEREVERLRLKDFFE